MNTSEGQSKNAKQNSDETRTLLLNSQRRLTISFNCVASFILALHPPWLLRGSLVKNRREPSAYSGVILRGVFHLLPHPFLTQLFLIPETN
jgi:hypothetical protein